MRLARPGRRVATLAVAVAMLAALSPATASAHGALRRSEPARGAHLDVAPRVVRLTFSERPELRFTSIELVGPDSAPVALGPLRLDSARTVTADVRGPLAGGLYTVVWQMAGDDGHPVRGRFTFVIAPGARGLAPPPLAPGEPAGNVAAPAQQAPPAAHHGPVSVAGGDDVFGAESPLYVAIRWLLYVALVCVLGVVAFRLAVLPVLGRRSPGARTTELTERASARSASIGVTASLALAATVVARLLAQSYAMHGPARALDAGFVAAMLWWTVWGWGWLLQLAGVVLALAGFLRARRGRTAGWRLAALGALLLAFTPALSGHAASSPRLTGLAVLADSLHVIGAGGWLGSLLVALGAGVPAALALGEGERGTAVRDLIDAFSPTALAFASVVAVTGLFAGWLHLGSLPALWTSDYGRTLLAKLAALFLLAATGAYNWLRARRALGDARGARRMRNSATVELALGAVVLLVTAILVATPTPAEATDERSAQVAAP